ncbi:putative glycosyl hydrolase, family 13, catalytic domain, starch synthase, catalytic [Septoria linicola]|nr:putative glycosyl hydrolase, family 13, catalytic domain, starch synthase, catalytic [Septoria linicola]
MAMLALFVAFCSFFLVTAYKYDPAYTEYNLNQNQTAVHPLDFWGEWNGHNYTASPDNWRFPFYTLFLDRFVNGDPYNDNINGTVFERVTDSNQMRHGGDLQGLVDTLDYLQGMGIKALYIAGSPFLNQPWVYDSYSPVDLSILDPHFGSIDMWRQAIAEIHAHGMYVILDNTFATMGDLIGFDGYLNESTPFSLQEHQVLWKTGRRYMDFDIGNTYNETCQYPRFWNETGYPIDAEVTEQMRGCYDSDFDQYGDTEAFGVYPDWRRQLSKFASVQDRLREWHPAVREKIDNFYCMAIAQLDFDGYRYDKAVQSTVDAMATGSEALRRCARKYGKNNFFVVGEVTGGNSLGSVYFGRGRQPDQLPENLTLAISLSHNSSNSSQYYIRNDSALDGGAFHYSTYRALTRFLGMDGNLEAGYDAPRNWVDHWNTFILTNDLVNANTGVFDPRHMFGVSNQDVFRWPAIENGVHRQLLGHFITIMLLPGVPKLLWGEEQQFYTLDSTNDNYIFGRQPMSTATAWQTHGCYGLDSTQYYQMPWDATRNACNDDSVSLDHRDPSAPIRNILRRMYHLRQAYPVLNDGFFLQQLSNQTWDVTYAGSSGVATETGLWSVFRSEFPGVQNLTTTMNGTRTPAMATSNSTVLSRRQLRDNRTVPDEPVAATPVWMLYSNLNTSQTYQFDCSDNSTGLNTTSLIAPYPAGTRVKNLFHPFDEHTLIASTRALGLAGSTELNGCLNSLAMAAYDHRAYVPKSMWVGPKPMITKFTPGHDARLLSRNTDPAATEDVEVSIEFSSMMDCDDVTSSVLLSSKTECGMHAYIDLDSVKCLEFEKSTSALVGYVPSTWSWSATLKGVANGVHRMTVDHPRAAITSDQLRINSTTEAKDHFMFRIGQANNPIVFTRSANYSSTVLVKQGNRLMLNHSAAGADLFRYSTDFGGSFSQWTPYQGGFENVTDTGKSAKTWDNDHIRVEYFSRFAGSSSHVQQGDLRSKARRFPHLYLNGPYNAYGFDAGLDNKFELVDDYTWRKNFMTEWSNNGTVTQVNVWGINPDGQPDQSMVMGDIDGDSVLDRLPPSSLAPVVLNITSPPPKPYLAWSYVINDGNLRFRLEPVGSMWHQLALYVLLWVTPLIFAFLSTWIFVRSFYKIKFNQKGITEKLGLSRLLPYSLRKRLNTMPGEEQTSLMSTFKRQSHRFSRKSEAMIAQPDARRKVLIATMEYDIEDWGIKIKIGGLGVMAQLMGKNLEHQDLIWVVPCAGGIEYPTDQVAKPMTVAVFGQTYNVNVQYHQLRNITYVLLDAPIFRQQSKEEPYPARMDDLDSAIYYSAWNQCIAQALVRFPVDLYHINDYHGTIAALYLLPRTVPVCLSLHNAEFQGLWPMRTRKERDEVCSVFNLPPDIVAEYVQFGEIFNLLHAGASYLRIHQEGFGAVGVSKKYGARAYTRYPIFWGLKEIKSLQNPDPSDTAAWDKKAVMSEKDIHIDEDFEKQRLEWRVQAQEWAELEVNPAAELFVFVGRWSMQKGIDLIADAFPAILESHPNVQLITVGPVIDLHGKFAALKLDKLMKLYPGRVCSKPVFTALPPFIFSGAEFALIPSRDEPFGLVAVEFGRKGALGVGARVGGLGQMPGWWYTVESTTPTHLLHQFKDAIRGAMSSSHKTRAMMRARSAKQRFPVAQWVEELEVLQTTSIHTHDRILTEKNGWSTVTLVHPHPSIHPTLGNARNASHGLMDGPGHIPEGQRSGLVSRCSFESLPSLASSREGDDCITPLRPSTPSTPGFLHSNRSSHIPPVPDVPEEYRRSFPESRLSLLNIVGEKNDFNLQKVDPFFTDSNGHFYRAFDKKLASLDGKNSETSNCIEDFIVKSEKEWFNEFRNAKLGMLKRESMSTLVTNQSRLDLTALPVMDKPDNASIKASGITTSAFELGDEYKPPTGLRKWMQVKFGTWPLYAYFLALGQIVAANSYQITLLTGEIGQSSSKLYVVASIYLAASIVWWVLFRRFASVVALSLPFFFYGAAFFLVGLAQYAPTYAGVGWVQNVGTGFYALASASGALFFALNFGDEGGAPIKSWVFRACVIQGTQQIYVVALWYWGSFLSRRTAAGDSLQDDSFIGTWKITAITLPIAVAMWTICLAMWLGLPSYYRQAPGRMPSFYRSIARRKVVLWFFVTTVVQNFFLSAPYGRNWSFLFSSQHAAGWQVMVLVVFFFVGVWAMFCGLFAHLSKSHSWILPLFAIGLGAPRWAQIFWATSNIGLWLPWAPGSIETGSIYIASALLSRSVWLWLGVLDAVQGVGLGMILLGTLTRTHVAFAVTAMQVIGSATTMLARGVAPNRIGPGPISPDISGGVDTLWQPWFWVGLIANLALCVGFYKFYRKEQLTKP